MRREWIKVDEWNRITLLMEGGEGTLDGDTIEMLPTGDVVLVGPEGWRKLVCYSYDEDFVEWVPNLTVVDVLSDIFGVDSEEIKNNFVNVQGDLLILKADFTSEDFEYYDTEEAREVDIGGHILKSREPVRYFETERGVIVMVTAPTTIEYHGHSSSLVPGIYEFILEED